jgi:hypothetical protein
LSIVSGGSITGFSSSKYVIIASGGNLKRFNVVSATDFPVGDATNYTPVTLTNPGTADNFTVSVSTTAAPSCVTTTPFSATTAVTGTWNISEDVAGGSNCTIAIDYGTVATGASFNASSAQIVHCTGTTADYFNGTASGTLVTGSGFTNFSPFGISSDAALPIELASFKGQAEKSDILLSFSTASEHNNAHFLIEHSTDGSRFTQIGKVTGAGNSTEERRYTFTDEQPAKGINFYRLKQVDFDGNFSYSPVVSVVFGKATGIRIAPMPVSDNLNVTFEESLKNDGIWQVYDMSGRLLQSGTAEAESAGFNIDVATLTTGTYLLRIVSGQDVMTRQFQK